MSTSTSHTGQAVPAGSRATVVRLLRLVGIHRAGAAMFTLGVVSISLNVLGPWLLGRATDLIFAGVLGRQFPGGSSRAEVAAGLRAGGDHTLARMVEATAFTPGQGFDMAGIGRVLAVALVVYAVSGLCWILQGRQATTAIQHSAHHLRGEVQAKLARLPLAYVDASKRGELLSRATNDIDTVVQSLQQTLSQLSNSLLLILAVLGMMVWISPVLALIALVVVPAAVALTAVVARRAQPHFRAQANASGELNAHVEEMYSANAVLTAFGRRDEAARRFQAHNDAVFQAAYRAQSLSGISQPTTNFINNVGYVLVAAVGCVWVATGTISLGSLQAVILYSRQLSGPLTQVTSLIGVVQSGVASAQRVFELLDAEEETPDRAVAPRTTGPRRPVGDVRFDAVSFRYDAARPLIDDVSISVRPGMTVAIVGPTGAGKTTLVNLLMRFYDVDGGQIAIDGVDIAELPRRELRRAVGMVLQDTWLFEGTIAENIGYGREGATAAEIQAAAAAAHADHFIRTLPAGYATLVDDSSGLSAGERQLITIARAFLADPAILVLDEATSSVDTRTEVLIRRAMRRLSAGRTSFVIAHRLSTVRDADVILVMADGAIVERGTHEDLLAAGGAYTKLYRESSITPTEGP